MPTTFAHDLFGAEVFKQAAAPVQKLVLSNKNLYRIGLHGPDVLFYYFLWVNKVNQYGVRLHKEAARGFFENNLAKARAQKNEALLSYLCGFACHLVLDSTCHPYIYSIEREVSHGEIEKELDRYLMLREGKDPFHYYPAEVLTVRRKDCRVMQEAFEGVSARQIAFALKGMKNVTKAMVYTDNEVRRQTIFLLLKLTGAYDKLAGNFMKKECDPALLPYLQKVLDLFETAVKRAPDIIEAVYRSYESAAPLPDYFDRNYNE
ncbi:MAG: zinc dependent phospholipase C family protein [Lachnospiraceae bacterium]